MRIEAVGFSVGGMLGDGSLWCDLLTLLRRVWRERGGVAFISENIFVSLPLPWKWPAAFGCSSGP